jgi:twitching motility two-component system response regulator PilH
MMTAANILVVEDHADLREMLTVLLESEGFAVRTAVNGVEALRRLEETRPSLILLDLMMPVMSGDEFRQRQLADPRYRDVPVICMTAAHDGRERAMRLHADDYFQKPLDFDQLMSVVRERVREAGGYDQLPPASH